MSAPTRQEILRLYKNILRYGQQLKLTDKTYFHQRIETEFKRNKKEADLSQIGFLYEKGVALLQNKRVK